MIQPRGSIAHQPQLVIASSTFSDGDLGRFSDRYSSIQAHAREKFFGQLGLPASKIFFFRPNRTNTVVADPSAGQVVTADAVIITVPNIYGVVATADCIPLVLYDPVTHIVAIAHVGWRDIVGRLIGALLDSLVSNHHVALGNLLVYFGPAVGVECYRQRGWRAWWKTILFRKLGYRTSIYRETSYRHFDLKKMACQELISRGVDARRVEVAPYCTVCSPDLFPSNIREQQARMQSIFTLAGRSAV